MVPTRLFWLMIAGVLLIMVGLSILVVTIKSFHTYGKGTLAPWNPPKKLVITGLYKHMRHPMIGGVILVLIGESIIFQSLYHFMFVLLFIIGNVVYLNMIEEPQLIKRFGEQYIEYQQNVPSIIPRVKPWIKK